MAVRECDGSGDARVVVNLGRLARRIATLIGILLVANADAQIAADVSVASENDFRGNSLSNGEPVATLAVTVDGTNGWFAGGLASEARFASYARTGPQLVVDAGYARSISSGFSWELGATSTFFPNSSFYDYGEVFAGFTLNNLTGRLYFAPNYYGRDFRTLYAELNYSHALGDRLRLLGHVGIQQSDVPMNNAANTTFDTRIGIGTQFGGFGLQINWVDTNRVSYLEPIVDSDNRHQWVVSLSHAL
ncbi:MAG: TorF family putative porin [Rudaea sp.]|nr:TorF family putative porin [Rudaea sp.]